MAGARLGTVLRHIEGWAVGPAAVRLGDRELLERFRTGRDEAAYAALVQRHAGLVWRVCRGLLPHEQDAEDALQATFLVLARRAGAVRKAGSLASWLHGVAHRTALLARRRAAARRACEVRPAPPAPEQPPAAASWRELQALLDAEVRRLPEKYRAAFVLCCLEGKTQAEVAAELGCKEGTVASRLARARERLRARLGRRGVALSAALTLLALNADATLAGRPDLVRSAVRAGLRYARGVSAPQSGAAALAEGVLRPGWLVRLKAGSAATASSSLLLVAGLLAAGAGAPARQTAEQPPPAAEPPAAAKAQPAKGDRLPAGAVARLGTTRWRHGAAVHDVAFSPDGKLIASNGELRHPGSPDSPIRLWDAATGRELWRLGDDSDWKGTPAFSPDGQRLFVPVAERGGKPGEVRIYDTATGRLVQSWPRRDTTTARSCALSPDGKVLAAPEARLFWTAEEKVPVVLLDATTGKELRRLEGHTGPTNCVAFSPDGKVLATGGSDKAVGLWDTATGRRLARLTDHATEVTAVALSPDGKYLAAASRGGVTLLWDLPAGRKPREVARQSMGGMVRFTPDGRLVAAGGQRTRLLEPATGKEVRRFPGVSSLVGSSLAVSPDGKALAASGEAGQIVFWDLASGKRLFQPEGHQRPVGSVALSPDGRVAASGSWDGTVRLWEVASGKGLRHLPFRDWGARVTFAADGSTLLTVGDDGMVRFWGAATGAERRRFPTEPRKDGPPVIASAVSADGRLAATSGRGHVIRLWDTATGRPAGALKGHTELVVGLAFGPGGKSLASCSHDGSVRLWDVPGGKEVRQLRGHEGRPGGVAFSPDGKVLASVGWDDKLVLLWDVATGGEVARLAGHEGWLTAVAFSPDGRVVASGGHDATVRLWEVATGGCRRVLEGHRGPVFDLAFAADGRTLASGGADAVVLVWDAIGRSLTRGGGPARLSAADLEGRWKELRGEDAARAYRALSALLNDPARTVPFLRRHLRPVPTADARRLARLIQGLDGAQFEERERATKELAALGAAAEQALRRAAEVGASAETKRRAAELLRRLAARKADRLPALRAVEALERIADADARKLLEEIAAGAQGAWLTEEARSALARLPKRPAP